MLPRTFQHLMLMVLLVLGVRPVAHSHDACSQTQQAIQELENHIGWYHTKTKVALGTFREWHVHWVFPGCLAGSMPSDEAVVQNEWSSFQSNLATWDAPIQQVALERFMPQLALTKLPFLVLDPNRSRQFVDHLSSELSLPELLGVMQC